MKISGFTQERGACTTLRIRQPLEKIASLKLADASCIMKADDTTEPTVRASDIVVLGRAASDHVLGIVQKMQRWGKKVVFDLDDNMMDVSVISPHYAQLGIMPVQFDMPDGTKEFMWKDGAAGFDAKRNRQIRKSFIDLIRASDCVTVTTEPLAKAYRRYNDCVRVIPNAIDFRVWDKPNTRWDGDDIRVLYTGAANHQEDWMFIRPVLEELQKKHPKMLLVFIGTDWKYIPNGLDYSRVEVHQWVDFEAYPYLMKSLCCHIGLAPISKTDFNDCRSELKWVEYSALKMATVASPWGPYKRSVKNGVTGILADEPQEWAEAISKLITDKELRERLGGNAYRECRKRFNLDYMVDMWMDVFQELYARSDTYGLPLYG